VTPVSTSWRRSAAAACGQSRRSTYDPPYAIKKADIDSFLFSEASRKKFTYRLLMRPDTPIH